MIGGGSGLMIAISLSSFSESLPPELSNDTSVSTSAPQLLEALRGRPLFTPELTVLSAFLGLSVFSFELSSSHS